MGTPCFRQISHRHRVSLKPTVIVPGNLIGTEGRQTQFLDRSLPFLNIEVRKMGRGHAATWSFKNDWK